MDQVFLLSLTASLNPTLVAATTVMLLLESPAKLMAGYLLGAYVTSITLGVVIVFSLSSADGAFRLRSAGLARRSPTTRRHGSFVSDRHKG